MCCSGTFISLGNIEVHLLKVIKLFVQSLNSLYEMECELAAIGSLLIKLFGGQKCGSASSSAVNTEA
jgi:hypothetical protein